MQRLLLLILFLQLYSCTSSENNIAGPETIKNDTVPAVKTVPPETQQEIYSVLINHNQISLRQWDSTLELNTLLGKPNKERIRQLDQNSDTHSGSYIRDLEYEGLKLKLFSPAQNGKSFWILEIILTSNKYQTSRMIRLGDSLQKVKQAYPEMKIFPGNTDNMFYVADAGYENSIEMGFLKDKLVKLRMYYMIP